MASQAPPARWACADVRRASRDEHKPEQKARTRGLFWSVGRAAGSASLANSFPNFKGVAGVGRPSAASVPRRARSRRPARLTKARKVGELLRDLLHVRCRWGCERGPAPRGRSLRPIRCCCCCCRRGSLCSGKRARCVNRRVGCVWGGGGLLLALPVCCWWGGSLCSRARSDRRSSSTRGNPARPRQREFRACFPAPASRKTYCIVLGAAYARAPGAGQRRPSAPCQCTSGRIGHRRPDHAPL
jgi:hypothetical protein